MSLATTKHDYLAYYCACHSPCLIGPKLSNRHYLLSCCLSHNRNNYPLMDLGPIHWLLGIKIVQNCADRTISLSQTSYADSILDQFSVSHTNPAKCPLPTGLKLGKDGPVTPQDMECMRRTPYREAIGSLMYSTLLLPPIWTLHLWY